MGSLKIAVAYDDAFCFYYRENFRELERAGLEIVTFSPLKDEKLPGGIAGLYIGGGYPELHAATLAGNQGIVVDINQKAAAGMPLIAECGGFMYLSKAIATASQIPNAASTANRPRQADKASGSEASTPAIGGKVSARDDSGLNYVNRNRTNEGVSWDMCGIFDGVCLKKDRAVRFGYVRVVDETRLWLPDGSEIKGHEFHYYDTDDNGSGATVYKAYGTSHYRQIHITETMWAGWPHLYFASNPSFAKGFSNKCSKYAGLTD